MQVRLNLDSLMMHALQSLLSVATEACVQLRSEALAMSLRFRPPTHLPQLALCFILLCRFQTFLSGCEPRDVAFTGLASNNRLYSFVPLSNRNIVLYKAGTPIWTSGTVSSRAGGPYSLVLQKDGDLVGYEGSAKDRTRFWSSGTGGRGVRPYRLAVQNNGNVVLYDGRGRPLWSTGTAEPFDHFFKRCGAAPASTALQAWDTWLPVGRLTTSMGAIALP